MSEVKIPEPERHDHGIHGRGFTKAQLKQYGDDRAREALEMAAKNITGTYAGITAVMCANLVLALSKEIK